MVLAGVTHENHGRNQKMKIMKTTLENMDALQKKLQNKILETSDDVKEKLHLKMNAYQGKFCSGSQQ